MEVRPIGQASKTPCPRCQGAGVVFECRQWPECACPGGTTRDGCPGATIPCPLCDRYGKGESE